MENNQTHIHLAEQSLSKESTTINLGPTHPATHGIFQNVMEIDGEKVLESKQTLGYIHRAFEKIAERRSLYQITPLTDRLNYCSAPINNIGWHLTVEKMAGIEVPPRVAYLRIIIMELARISDHIVCNNVIGVDAGALTPFTYMYQWREKIYDIYESICGNRLTTNIGRIGGFERNFNEASWEHLNYFIEKFPKAQEEFEALLTRNRIFMERTIGAGPIGPERALNYGFTGPNLRAAGVDYDVRVHNPYSRYEEFDFNIPVGKNGDSYDRFLVRNHEMWESLSIIKQAVEKLKDLDPSIYHADVPGFYLPEKERVYTRIEELIYHFKIIYGENDIPAGEVYHPVEGGNGELGFYFVSDGGRTPYRLHFRRPCFIYYQAFSEMVTGGLLSDAIITLSSLNVIAGELDA